MSYEYSTKVYHYDTDCGGVVYHGKYLDMLLRARDAWQLSEGYDICSHAHAGIAACIRSLSVEYIKPARLDDDLLIETQADVHRAYINFEQKIVHAKSNELLCSALVKVGFVNLETEKMVPINQIKK